MSIPGSCPTNMLSLGTQLDAKSSSLTLSPSGLPASGFPPLLAGRVKVAIEPYSSNCEVFQVTAASAYTVNLAPSAARTHPAGASFAIIENGRITPQLFGAIANGGDCSAAINAAVGVAAATEVYLPAGEYGLSSTIKVERNNVKFCGDGDATRLKVSTNTMTPALLAVGSNIGIFDLTILGTQGDTSGTGVAARNCENFEMRRCRIEGFGGNGVYTSGGGDLLIEKNSIVGTSPNAGPPSASYKDENGIYCVSGGQNIRIIGNDISGTGQGVASDTTINRLLVASNTIHDLMQGDQGRSVRSIHAAPLRPFPVGWIADLE